MISTNNTQISNPMLPKQNSLLLIDQEAKKLDHDDKLLLPNSTRSLKRRTSLLEKSRDWVNNFLLFIFFKLFLYNDTDIIFYLIGSTSYNSSSSSS